MPLCDWFLAVASLFEYDKTLFLFILTTGWPSIHDDIMNLLYDDVLENRIFVILSVFIPPVIWVLKLMYGFGVMKH